MLICSAFSASIVSPLFSLLASFVACFERLDCGAAVTFDEIRLIKEEIRTCYALPLRDFLEFAYREKFPGNESARVAFALGHYNFFLSALSRSPGELAPHREMLRRLCQRHDAPVSVLDEVNRDLVFEMMKLTAFQRRNSPGVVAAYNLVVAEIAHVLWSAMAAAPSPRTEAA